MLGIVIATHGQLSDGLKDSATVIMGTTSNIATVNLNSGDNIEELGLKIKQAIQTVDSGEGIIVLVDVISASPYNQSLLAVSNLEKEIQESTYIIGGVNLPMLLETINHQIVKTPVHQIAQKIIEQGLNSIDSWHISKRPNQEVEEDDDF